MQWCCWCCWSAGVVGSCWYCFFVGFLGCYWFDGVVGLDGPAGLLCGHGAGSNGFAGVLPGLFGLTLLVSLLVSVSGLVFQ